MALFFSQVLQVVLWKKNNLKENIMKKNTIIGVITTLGLLAIKFLSNTIYKKIKNRKVKGEEQRAAEKLMEDREKIIINLEEGIDLIKEA